MLKLIASLILAAGIAALPSTARAGGVPSFEIGVTSGSAGSGAVLVTNQAGSTLFHVFISSGAQGDYIVC